MHSMDKNKLFCKVLYNIVACISGIVSFLFMCAGVWSTAQYLSFSTRVFYRPGFPSPLTQREIIMLLIAQTIASRNSPKAVRCYCSIAGKSSNPSEFSSPESIAIDGHGNFYVVDSANAAYRYLIKKASPSQLLNLDIPIILVVFLKNPKVFI